MEIVSSELPDSHSDPKTNIRLSSTAEKNTVVILKQENAGQMHRPLQSQMLLGHRGTPPPLQFVVLSIVSLLQYFYHSPHTAASAAFLPMLVSQFSWLGSLFSIISHLKAIAVL